jgi:probable H4MPT-linked C1 transfer pathway protein
LNVLGWDIGGANLKVSDGEASSIERPFPLWQRPDDLTEAIRSLAGRFAPADRWAVTMTGELADCFLTKAEGVRRILSAVEQAAGETPIGVWTTVGEFVDVEHAVETPILVAAANWHALATWAGRMVPQGVSLLVDIGSTTTDIIPLVDGFPDPEGRTDLERLISGELAYTGVRRTPVSTLAASVTFQRRKCPLAAETFATTLDVYLMLGKIAEDAANVGTANGRPATRSAAHDRLARMICADREECTEADAVAIAEELALAQTLRISAAISRVARRFPKPPTAVIASGSGEFLAQAALHDAGKAVESAPRSSLSEILGPMHSTAACALALARLGRERN